MIAWQMGDDCLQHGWSVLVLIKMFDGTVRELKDLRYAPQMKKNLMSIRALKAQGLEFSGKDKVLKMLKDSMVVLKGVRYNNIYLLKGNTVTGQLITSVGSNDDSSWLNI